MSEAATRFRPAPVGGVLDADADHGSEQARAAGWAAGWAAGSRAAAVAASTQRQALDDAERTAERGRAAALEAALDVLRRAADAVSARTVPLLDSALAQLDDGAVELARAVLGRELSAADDGARAALARALSAPVEVGVHTVRLHPADLAVLEAAGALAGLPLGVALVADATLAPGDAVSVFADGFLDARIATALDRARLALAEGPR
ncbi:FliH/SctL family protein [Pengzhenrongella sicca]|uniref:Flagellar assembly protein FliH/Type III secretion system HrpE domain-containing protein n=1 Tax=Pengzhenrongella sicca TaxID=2819238 RepID=A0A8A4ZEN5_9MICO|nr:FliH/SctL family protein [Pengzhenrongella sicca]QTE29871.1 hypothetical protein J4E96_02220 [Pengzhenrongella sicca]